jgi:hypothetical protein
MEKVIKLKLLDRENLVEIKTSARTFGEFKAEPEVEALSINWEASKLIDRATKSSFDLDESILPEVNSIMFVTPTKTKSGTRSYKEAKAFLKKYKEEGNTIPFNYTQATTQQMNDFIDMIAEEPDSQPKSSDEDWPLLSQVSDLLERAIRKLEEYKTTTGRDTDYIKEEIQDFKSQLAEFITKDDLSLEAEALSLRFK